MSDNHVDEDLREGRRELAQLEFEECSRAAGVDPKNPDSLLDADPDKVNEAFSFTPCADEYYDALRG